MKIIEKVIRLCTELKKKNLSGSFEDFSRNSIDR